MANDENTHLVTPIFIGTEYFLWQTLIDPSQLSVQKLSKFFLMELLPEEEISHTPPPPPPNAYYLPVVIEPHIFLHCLVMVVGLSLQTTFHSEPCHLTSTKNLPTEAESGNQKVKQEL